MKRKIFVSWSGSPSREVADLFAKWVPDVLPGIKAWISGEDIEKGSVWFPELARNLAEVRTGVLCLTRQNLNAPWILFEAGALSKGMGKNRVCPLLIDLRAADLTPPLAQLNCTLPNYEDMLKLIKVINKGSEAELIADTQVERIFNRWWPDFDEGLKKILAQQQPQPPPRAREQGEVLEEILQSIRSLLNTEQARTSSSEPLDHRVARSVVAELSRMGVITGLHPSPSPFDMEKLGEQ